MVSGNPKGLTRFADRGARARDLADRYPASREILDFYAALADWQHETAPAVSGFDDLTEALPALVELVKQTGPPTLAATGAAIVTARFRERIRQDWESVTESSTEEFFTRALLEIYASKLPDGLDCPWCSQLPQAGCLRTQGDGLALDLVCALCFRRRNFPRSQCPFCNESRETQLITYSTADFPHLRLRACDSCRGYFLVVDLEKDLAAIPEVDELAGIALDLWAREQGYQKFQPNIVGI